MEQNVYSLKVMDKFWDNENTAMILFEDSPFHFHGDEKTYRWHLECVYDVAESKMDMYFLVYDEEEETYVCVGDTNQALELDALDYLSPADFMEVMIMMNQYVK